MDEHMVDFIEFGAGGHPDKVLSLITSNVGEPGAGIGISQAKYPEKLSYDSHVTKDDKYEEDLVLWFYNTKSVDVWIDKLKRIKEILDSQ